MKEPPHAGYHDLPAVRQLGDAVAGLVCDRLGYRILDKNLLTWTILPSTT